MQGDSKRFHDRQDAGTELAAGLLEHLRNEHELLVVGLPRGGVPVADRVARALRAPLDVLVVRKVGAPEHEELAIGAVAAGGLKVLNSEVIDQLAIPQRVVEEACAREIRAADRYEQLLRPNGQARIDIAGKSLVIVDDGIATGATIRAASQVASAHGARRVVIAVPVAPHQVLPGLIKTVDEVICIVAAYNFTSVSEYYDNFMPVSNEEVLRLLTRVSRES